MALFLLHFIIFLFKTPKYSYKPHNINTPIQDSRRLFFWKRSGCLRCSPEPAGKRCRNLQEDYTSTLGGLQHLFISFSSCPIQKITHQTLSQIIDTAAGDREAGAVCQVEVPPFDGFDAGDVYQVGDGGFDEAFIGQNRGDYLVEGLPQGDALDDGAVLQVTQPPALNPL